MHQMFAKLLWGKTIVCIIQKSPIPLKPLTGEVNNIDYFVTVVSMGG